jgi:hypothetical protein
MNELSDMERQIRSRMDREFADFLAGRVDLIEPLVRRSASLARELVESHEMPVTDIFPLAEMLVSRAIELATIEEPLSAASHTEQVDPFAPFPSQPASFGE